jgi:methylenetetrahydrofolate--tRNA-(uracil-5-)-methyltransferase
LSKEEYLRFVDELCRAEKVPFREFEKGIHFEGCMPIEVLAERGEMTLAFGPMKPVGLPDPRTGKEPFAVLQLRQENRRKSLFNMVGFQTKLNYPEQRRIFRTIPGLENARFARLGSMHRNTFINAPRCLLPSLQLKTNPRLFFAGQITGVEGYVESAACGFLAGIFAACRLKNRKILQPPATTALGALVSHLVDSDEDNFQPMNVNYGLFPPLEGKKPRKRADRRLAVAERALQDVDGWWKTIEEQRSKI